MPPIIDPEFEAFKASVDIPKRKEVAEAMLHEIRGHDMVATVDVKKYRQKLTEDTKKYFTKLGLTMEDPNGEYLINSVLWLTIDVKDIAKS